MTKFLEDSADGKAYEKTFKALQDWVGPIHDQLLLDGLSSERAALVIMGAFIAGVANITAQMDFSTGKVLDGIAFALREGKKKVKPRLFKMQ